MRRVCFWLIAATAAGLLAGAAQGQPKAAPLKVGDRVPDFTVQDLRGRELKLSDLRKQARSGVVSLTFWCSFCHSCRHAEGALDRLAQEHQGQVTIAALDASAGETAEGVAAFAKEKGLKLPIFLDAKARTADLFGVGVTTTTLVIDREGVLRYRGQFAASGNAHAASAIRAVLAGKEPDLKETPLRG